MGEYNICGYDLREIQKKMLDMLIELDRICKTHNIKYSLEGGSLLGAVKYGGFVPWDDDIDVVMTRENYEKFKSACKTDLNSGFFLQNTDTEKLHPLNYSKLRTNDTIYMQKNYAHLDIHHGLFLDVFPLDYVDKKTFRGWCSLLGLFFGARTRKLNIRMKQPKWKKLIYSVVSIMPISWINNILNLVFKALGKKKTEYVFEMCSPVLSNSFQKASRYEEYTELEFEGRKFMVIKDYEALLKEKFGDYMNTEPDPSTRGPSHAIIKCKL